MDSLIVNNVGIRESRKKGVKMRNIKNLIIYTEIHFIINLLYIFRGNYRGDGFVNFSKNFDKPYIEDCLYKKDS